MASLLKNKNILGLEEMCKEDIVTILDTADSMKQVVERKIKKVPTLRGRTVLNLFYEPSTRTKSSFDLACKYLSGQSVSISKSGSAFVKGETLKDAVHNIETMGAEVVIMRHPVSGAPHYLAKRTDIPVVNAGDGMHEHPTQALLDILTIRQKKGRIEGLTVTIVGDIRHSRVARSNIWGLNKLGATVRVAAPSTLLPPYIEELDVDVFTDVEKAIEDADVVMALRIQKERQLSGYFPSLREYAAFFGLTKERLTKAKEDVLVMHPGPINRGVELTSEVADAPNSVILDQVPNGVAIRMAILYLLLGGGSDE